MRLLKARREAFCFVHCPTVCFLVVALSGCFVGLSRPRGEAHLAAMEEASQHQHHGRDTEAAEAYGRAAASAERRVDNDEARYRQARSLRDDGQRREALALLDGIAARRPVSRRTARAHFDAALIRLELGETAAGYAGLLSLCRNYPDAGPASRALRLLIQARRDASGGGDTVAFLAGLYEELKESDLGDDLLSELAAIHSANGEFALARATLERLVSAHPYPHGQRWDDALWRLADLAEQEGESAAAIAYLERMLSVYEDTIDPGSHTLSRFPEAQLRIGRLYWEGLADRRAAAQAFWDTYERFPTSRVRDDALLALSEMALAQGEHEQACALLGRLLDEFTAGRARRRANELQGAHCSRD